MPKRQTESLKRNKVIRDTWVPGHYPDLAEVASAAHLAHQGLLGPVEAMWLRDVDLASVPAAQLASLAARVMGSVYIWNTSGCDLSSLIRSLRSEVLSLNNQRLGAGDTQALVRALESGVERLHLGRYGEVTLNITDLAMYNGGGKCRVVSFGNETSRIYRAEVRNWAQMMNWKVTYDMHDAIYINAYAHVSRAIILF